MLLYGSQGASDPVSRGNAVADAAAKTAAHSAPPQANHMVPFPVDSLPSLGEMQSFATAVENALWKQNQCYIDS